MLIDRCGKLSIGNRDMKIGFILVVFYCLIDKIGVLINISECCFFVIFI